MTDATSADTILLVDDNPGARYVKKRLLSRHGYRILEAENGADALSMAATERPDLMLLDVNLPDTDGFALCRQLKTTPETQYIKVLQTSAARIGSPDRLRSLNVGADAYLVEPAEEEELIGTVQALLKLGKQERDNRRLIERLTESETRYRSLVERMPAAMYTIDRDGRITFYNDQAAELWGRRPRLTDHETRFCGSHRLFWPDGTPLPHDKTPMVDAVQSGTSLHGREVVIERPDGSRRHVIVHIDPLRDAEGHVVGAVNLFTDITERRQAEQELRDSEERLRVAQAATNIGTFEWDIVGGKIIWSRETERMWGLAEGAYGGTYDDWKRLVHPDDIEGAEAIVRQSLEYPGMPYVYEHRIIWPDGTIRWIYARANTFYDADHRPIRMIGVNLDVTERRQAEQKLRESEALLAAVLKQVPLGIGVMDMEGRWTLTNPIMSTFVPQVIPSKLPDRVVRWRAWDEQGRVIPPEHWPGQRALRGAVVSGLEMLFTDDRGRERWVLVSAGPLHAADGRLVGGICTVQDIDQLRRAQDAMRRSEEQLALVSNIVPALISYVDTECRYRMCNRAYTEWFGLPCEDVVGRRMSEVLGEEAWRVIEPRIRSALTGESMDFETQVCYRRGGIRWIHEVYTPHRDETGRVLGLVVLVSDITERKRAEQVLRETEARFKTMADVSPVIMWVTDATGGIEFINQAYRTFCGVTDTDVQGNRWEMVVHPDDRDGYVAEFRRGIRDQGAFYAKCRIRRADGTWRWIASYAAPRWSSEGKFQGHVGSSADIHDLIEVQRSLQESQERLRALADNLEARVDARTRELVHSQERLRTMATELNLAEQRERKRLATELHDHLQQLLVLGKLTVGQGKRFAIGIPGCEQALKKADDIFSDALAYTRTLVSDLSPTVLRDHGLAAALKWLAEYMEHKHGQTVAVQVPDGEGVDLPEDQRLLIFQSVRELLINSSKHAGTGIATLSMEAHGDNLSITVSDEGKGFDLAAAAGIPSGGISSKFGLLSIRERMRAMGGSFDIRTRPGEGTVARLVLPVTQQGGRKMLTSDLTDAPHSELSPQEGKLPSRAVRVLLVDDHAMVRQGLRYVLDAYEDIQVVGEAHDGVEAVRLVEELRPRVVVMDINMPKMNGIEATTRIKSHWPESTVVGISVNTGDENSEAMKRAGAATVLPKDSAVEQLHDTIVQAVGAH